jgi:hypothetical protein
LGHDWFGKGHKKRLTGKSSKPFEVCIAQSLGNGFLSFPEESFGMPPPVVICDCFHMNEQI